VGAQSITNTLVYTYNGDGVRVAQEVDGVETRWVQDTVGLAQVLMETSGGAETIYLYGHARLAQVEGADAEWFLGDALGSVRQVVDDGGDVVLARDYSPFGVVRSESGTGSSGYGFTGEQYDPYIDMLFLRARWYSVGTGGFVSQDPWSGSIYRPATLHGYLYASGNPINQRDPSGRQPYIDAGHGGSAGDGCCQDECDPSAEAATLWLIDTMRNNSVSSEALYIRSLNIQALAISPLVFLPIPSVCKAAPVVEKGLAYKKWIDMVRTGGPWDFKRYIRERREGFEWGGEFIRMCCGGYQYEVVANIHYGCVGRAAGFTGLELKMGAGVFNYLDNRMNQGYQERIERGEVGLYTYYDEPEDQAAIQIGIDLYGGGSALSPERFCRVFDRLASRLKIAP